MKFFSKKGDPSTVFEKTLFLGIVAVITFFYYPIFVENYEYHQVFEAATPEVKKTCINKTNYLNLWLWTKNQQNYYDCIMASEDVNFRIAAMRFFSERGVILRLEE